jgi:hypothetical protein
MAGIWRALVLWLARRFGGRLRHPQLFAIALVLFVVDLFVPDLIPMVDELLLLVATLWLGSLRERASVSKGPASGAPPGPKAPPA